METAFIPEVEGIGFDTTPEQLIVKLDERNFTLIMPDYSMTPSEITDPVRDGRKYNRDGSYFFSTLNGIHFSYNADGMLFSISVEGTDIATAEGLRAGDSVEKMRSAYNSGYRKNIENAPVYQYFNGNEYLNIFYEDGLISAWSISLNPGVNTD